MATRGAFWLLSRPFRHQNVKVDILHFLFLADDWNRHLHLDNNNFRRSLKRNDHHNRP